MHCYLYWPSYVMGVHVADKKKLKKIFKQLSGELSEDDYLLPEFAIKGVGHIWCYDPMAKQVIRIARGIKCLIIDGTLDDLDRIMVYTIGNDVILIEENELFHIGFD